MRLGLEPPYLFPNRTPLWFLLFSRFWLIILFKERFAIHKRIDLINLLVKFMRCMISGYDSSR